MNSLPQASADTAPARIDFQTTPANYRHWQVTYDGAVATVAMDVTENATLADGYELKLNSYDLGVDIELYDIVQRMRFEHPEVGAVVITSARERVFCAGANIRMLGSATHAHKVNFCKFTNETRNAIEDASAHSGQVYLCAINGPCAGGGYELALACERILLIDDGSTTVSLPELPLLGVLPGTGGLTRLVDKRHVRRDRADFFCTVEEGVRGARAVEWNLVDELVPGSAFSVVAAERAADMAAASNRPQGVAGIELAPLAREFTGDTIRYAYLTVTIDRTLRAATFTLAGPTTAPPADVSAIHAAGASFWPLALARELDDAILHLRANEDAIGTWVFRSEGSLSAALAFDALLDEHADDWFVREVRLYLKRVLKRLDVSSRSLIAAIAPGSCFAGALAEIVFACDQAFMLDGEYEGDPRPAPTIALSRLNFGELPMVNGLTRLEGRFLADPDHVGALAARCGETFDAAAAADAGLVTFTPDDIDWDDEIRIVIEARASYSPDALTGMEANLRFAGPETLESKIFARLSAWQNWIFQRPNAVGEQGALVRYGSGTRPDYNKQRV